MAAPAHATPHHGRAHQHPNYLMIFWVLAILTVLEVGVIFMPFPRMAINVLLGPWRSQGGLVAAYFMHLRFEVRTLGLIALTPLAIAILLIFIILPDSFAIIKQTEKKKPVPAASAPGGLGPARRWPAGTIGPEPCRALSCAALVRWAPASRRRARSGWPWPRRAACAVRALGILVGAIYVNYASP
jgi:caa(3)-type oxidase subunit IV